MCSGSLHGVLILALLAGVTSVQLQKDVDGTAIPVDAGPPPLIPTFDNPFYDDSDETPRILVRDVEAPNTMDNMMKSKSAKPDRPGDKMMKKTGNREETLISTTPLALTRSIPVGISVVPVGPMGKMALSGWKLGEAEKPIMVVRTKTISNRTIAKFTVKPTMEYGGRIMMLGGKGRYLQHVKLIPETTYVAPGYFMHARQIAGDPHNDGDFTDPIAGLDLVADVTWGSLYQIQKWHRRVHFHFRGDGQVNVKFAKPPWQWDDKNANDFS